MVLLVKASIFYLSRPACLTCQDQHLLLVKTGTSYMYFQDWHLLLAKAGMSYLSKPACLTCQDWHVLLVKTGMQGGLGQHVQQCGQLWPGVHSPETQRYTNKTVHITLHGVFHAGRYTNMENAYIWNTQHRYITTLRYHDLKTLCQSH